MTCPHSLPFPLTSPVPPSAPPSPWRFCGGWGAFRKENPDHPPPCSMSRVRHVSSLLFFRTRR
ncbi:hypothetical protein LDENG_00009330 [Lucifuga dentata]|nr:hypothetical protein LDENG_00009330 [Lucifuga dentata]